MEEIRIDNQELISVIMCAYNEDLKWIKESVESVLNQTYKNLELIIVLDNPNNSELKNLLDSYAKKDNRIVLLINEENMGVSESSNRAIKACKGKYIARMDADDISEINRILLQKSYLESNNLDFIFSGIKCIDENSTVKYETHKRSMDYKKVKKLFRIVNISYHPTWFMKKEVYENLEGYREIPNTEDYDFILRALNKGYKMGRMNQNITRYRIRETSISVSNSLEQFLYMRVLTKNYKQNEIDDYNKVLESIKNVKESISIKDRENYKKANSSYERGVIYWKNKNKIKAILKFLTSILDSKYMLLKYFGLFRYKLADKLY